MHRLRLGSIDLAALVLWPYAIGFLVAVIYYSRYRIFSVALLSPQYIIMGCYVLILYGVVPYLVLRMSATLFRPPFQAIVAITILLGLDVVLSLLLHRSGIIPMGWLMPIHLMLFQLAGFTLSLRRLNLTLSPGVLRVGIGLALASLHFSYFFAGNVPYYLGGAKPVDVTVLPSGDGIVLRNRFSQRLPEADGKRQTVKLKLLFESGEEFFFLDTIQTSFVTNGVTASSATAASIVVRVPKRLVDRMQYYTPRWLRVQVAPS